MGEILKALEENGLLKNTLVILSSDNGPVVDDGYHDGAVEQLGSHRPPGPLRGGKYSIFEGGTRVPFIVRYPGKVKPGISHALFSQVDLFASLSALIGEKPALETKDSRNQLNALLGKDKKGREEVVVHSQSGGAFAIIEADWKYITPTKGAALQKDTQIELGNSPSPQLYHLKRDTGEKNNLAENEPALKSALEKRLTEIRDKR
ncbi:Arylsulfatase [compost metagenome]